MWFSFSTIISNNEEAINNKTVLSKGLKQENPVINITIWSGCDIKIKSRVRQALSIMIINISALLKLCMLISDTDRFQ